jgi:hypothetical protein
MKDTEGKTLADYLDQLFNGIYSERVEAASALGDAGDMQAIPFLRRALKRLRPPQPHADSGGPTTASEQPPDDPLVHDPEIALRIAIIEAITKLLLGLGGPRDPVSRELKPTLSQAIDFADGSRLKVRVEAPLGADDDLASMIYVEQLLPLLNQIGGQPGELLH